MTSVKPISLAYNVFESCNGSEVSNPIIFLHGLGGYKEHWRDIPQKVAEETRRKVYAVDARNHGDSKWSEEFNFDINAMDLLNFIEQIGAQKVTVVGHSMGGITSMKAALKMPSKIDKLAIEDIGIEVPDDILDTVKLLFSLYEQSLPNIPTGSSKQEAKKFIDDFVVERLPEEFKSLINKEDNTELDFLKQNPDGSFNFRSNLKVLCKALEDKDTLISKYYGKYDGPACFIYGGKSIFPVVQDAENIKTFFPKASFVGIEGATHNVHAEEPSLFTDALIKFLKE